MEENLWQAIGRAELPPGKAGFWRLGQMGAVLRMAGETILIDPYLSGGSETGRLTAAPFAACDLTPVRWVLGTHDHDDHIDRPAWREIAKGNGNCRFVAPRAHLPSLEQELPRQRLMGLNDGESGWLGTVRVTAVAAAHELLEPDSQGNYPCLSYVLEAEGKRVFHGGDMCLYEGLAPKLRALGPFDLMMLPINGRDARRLASGCIGNMTYQEAVDLAGLLRPGHVTPGHYDMFAHNGENPELFQSYLEEKYNGIACHILPVGEMLQV